MHQPQFDNGMKRSLTYLAAAVIIASGCSQKEITAPERFISPKDTVDLSITGLDLPDMEWKEGDGISLFSTADTKSNRLFTVVSREVGTATFSGRIVRGSRLCAVYPYSEENSVTVDGKMLTVTGIVPASQIAGQPSDLYVAVSDDGNFSFLPSCAKARITVKADGSEEEIKAVSVTAAGGENLSGKARVMAFEGGIPVMLPSTDANGSSATLNGEWTIGEEPLTLDISVIPGALAEGYTISVTKSDGIKSEKKYETPVTFRSGSVTALADFVFEGPKYYFLYTADEKLAVEGYKHEFSDGEGKIYLNTPEIPAGLLTGNTVIKGVHIPADIETIGDQAFDNCTSLASLTFEEGSVLTSIGSQAFRKTAVKTVNFPKSLNVLGVQSFNNAASLVTVTFPDDSNLETISQGVFNGAVSLKDVVIPASVKSLDKAFNTKFTTKLTITFKGVTPPTLAAATGIFNLSYLNAIYVPAESVDAYKTAWGTYAKYIKAIE